jgi:nucleolar GTP-binding protein
MNFQTIPPVETSKSLLNLAFGRARQSVQELEIRGDILKALKRKESTKLDVIKDVLTSRLHKMLRDFPETIKLPPFYVQLMQLTLDFPEFKKSFGALTWVIGKISFFHRQYVSKLNRESDRFRVGVISREFYGRISSVLKQIESNLKYLEESRRIMKTYPDIKEMFTVCVYGFPNVGKTTLLNKLTGTKAEVANYSFTTVTINAGYFKMGGKDIQVLDVPGTLARKEKMNLIEAQAELVLQELADVIVFVFDLSEHCGYSVDEQEKLLETVGKSKKVLVYVSKQDMTEKKVLEKFSHKHYSVEEMRRILIEMVMSEKGDKDVSLDS